jgi:hypothetical protein
VTADEEPKSISGEHLITEREILELKRVYALLQSAEMITQYGPLRAYVDRDMVQKLFRETIDPAVARVAKTETKVGEGLYVASAPSPWHTLFYLQAQRQHLYRGGRPFGLSAVELGDAGGEHLFFRGQRCASWGFHSSLDRVPDIQRDAVRRATEALVGYFRSFISRDDVAENTGRCFAQHYGIPTDLADISSEVDVAVWFATHPVGRSCPSGEADAVVRAVSWAAQQEAAKTVFLLPPPFVRNVYQQRGFFLDTSRTDGFLRGSLSLDVRFPRVTIGGDFEVFRHAERLEVWPASDECERELVEWARSLGDACPDTATVRRRVQAEREGGRLPRFWLERRLFEFERYVPEWLSMLDWVLPATCVTAMPVVSGEGPMRYEILDLKVRALVRANPSFFGALVAEIEGRDFSGFEVLQKIVLIARSELGAKPDESN